MKSPSLTRFAWIAIAASGAVIALKLGAWLLTGSVGLLSDALESVANLAGAVMAYLMLALAARPPDDNHTYGHSKAEYFSTGFEGALILIAAGAIAWTAVPRLLAPRSLESLGLGLSVALAATALNLGVARLLLGAAREHGSIALEASGRHLMTDVWTSVGVVAGVGAVALTGWERLDPVIALLVAAHILATGYGLVRRSALGLLDTALSPDELEAIHEVLEGYGEQGIRFHALRTRRAGRRAFVSVHVLVPGRWTVQRGHDLVEELESRVRERVPGATVLTHLEPVEDPASFRDRNVEPPAGGSPPR